MGDMTKMPSEIKMVPKETSRWMDKIERDDEVSSTCSSRSCLVVGTGCRRSSDEKATSAVDGIVLSSLGCMNCLPSCPAVQRVLSLVDGLCVDGGFLKSTCSCWGSHLDHDPRSFRPGHRPSCRQTLRLPGQVSSTAQPLVYMEGRGEEGGGE